MEDGRNALKTPLDNIINILKNSKSSISASKLALQCSMKEKDVIKWLDILEKNGNVRIENRIDGIYVKWTGEADDESPSADLRSSAEPEGEKATSVSIERDIEIAKERELLVKKSKAERQPERKASVDTSSASIVDVGSSRLERVERLIETLKAKKESLNKKGVSGENKSAEEPLGSKGEIPAGAASEEKKPLDSGLAQKEKDEGAPALGSSADANQAEEKPKAEAAEPIRVKIDRIKASPPVEVAGTITQFSERIARQMRRIEQQAKEIDKLRQEKEKLLNEYYLPLQYRLESELETISERMLKIQSKIVALQKNASDLPSKVALVEKTRMSSVKAHAEMRKAYDETCALIEETGRQLAEEREKLEAMMEQNKIEISKHHAAAQKLEMQLTDIQKMEEEVIARISSARAELAEQAERLAVAESYSNELNSIKNEIKGSLLEMRKEVASAKRALEDMRKQLGQIRQIEDYTKSIQQEYGAMMQEIDRYIRDGNREFDSLREAVEANFVRRYLRELRSLTEGYSFEFGQIKRMEADIDDRISKEREKLEQLFEEGRKIAYLFETQVRLPDDSDSFASHGKAFQKLSEITSKRSQVEQMISQIVSGKKEERHFAFADSAFHSEPIEVKVIKPKKRAKKAGRKGSNAKRRKAAKKRKT